jgi:hypothetical protein
MQSYRGLELKGNSVIVCQLILPILADLVINRIIGIIGIIGIIEKSRKSRKSSVLIYLKALHSGCLNRTSAALEYSPIVKFVYGGHPGNKI